MIIGLVSIGLISGLLPKIPLVGDTGRGREGGKRGGDESGREKERERGMERC